MKSLNLEQLKTIVEDYKKQNKKIIWTNGCFDLLHPGHIYSLKKAKEKAEILIVGLDSDQSIKKLKGNSRPIISEQQRINSLAALEFVDHIIVFNFGEAKYIIKTIKPHIYIKSGNYNLQTINQDERKIVEDYGGEIFLPAGLPGFSTTEIIKKLKNNKINMSNNLFDRTKIIFKQLSERENKSGLEVMINPDQIPQESTNQQKINHIANEIIKARSKNKPVILAFGAHLIKNGLSPILIRLMEENYITHLATNGASTIHDWEFAYQGKSAEDVRKYLDEGQFGLWEDTGFYLNLAIIAGAAKEKGYGESIGEMIHKDKIEIPENLSERLKSKLKSRNIQLGQTITVNHPNKNYSFQEAAFKNNVDYTVHPHFGHDIYYTHPLNDGLSLGVGAEIDLLKFTNSISNLDGGVYLSIGSSIMSPQVFEKALSMARNVAHQENRKIKDFMIVVNDIQDSGNWDWNSTIEPSINNPAYYLRFCKSFARSGSREMHYIQEDNRSFLSKIYHELKKQNTNL